MSSLPRILALAVAALLLPSALHAADRTQVVKFRPGTSSATLKGAVKGYGTSSYILGASAGQAMSVHFKGNNGSCYFNVMAPGGGDALFDGSINGDDYAAALGQTGDYTVMVYLMRNEARRNKTCAYSITFVIGG